MTQTLDQRPLAPTRTRGEWLAMHIYYAASPQPLLVGCVRPLIADLTADGLLAGHFFINYWLEGPHVRLRLRPARPDLADAVRSRTEAAVSAFLRRRPALYHVEETFLDDLYNTFLDMELEGIDKAEYTGADNRMRLRPNNSWTYLPYEPELGKYGGPAGVELAEWHFQESSDVVLEALHTLNVHLRTVRLGTAAQLMMVMSSIFLPDHAELLYFCTRYHGFWQRTFSGTEVLGTEEYGTRYGVTDRLRGRFEHIRGAVASGELDRLPGLLSRWARHSVVLRERVDELARSGQLVFAAHDGGPDLHITDITEARVRLLSPYLHMTHNRLSVTIRDEAYLSHLLAAALEHPSTSEERT